MQHVQPNKSKLQEYTPLIIVLVCIAAVATAVTMLQADQSVVRFLQNFMGVFFGTFGIFKLLDLKGFASAYAEYDILAKRSKAYAYLYPFIEIALAILYLGGFALVATNVATIVITTVSSVGVIRTLTDKKAIRCVCLGTVVKLPMTTVTVIEDLGMAAMALAMLVIGLLG